LLNLRCLSSYNGITMNCRAFFIIMFFSLVCIFVQGQDLIVTTVGDSIKCKIIDIGNDYIVVEDEDEVRQFINRRKVAKIDYNYYSKEHKVPPPNTEWATIRASIDGGFGLLTGKVKDTPVSELKDYYKRLKTGWTIGLSGAYFIREYFGFGLKYNLMKTRTEADDLSKNVLDGRFTSGYSSSNVSIHYLGPQFVLRYYLPNTKFCFLLDFGLGYIHYSNKEAFEENGTNYSESYKITGSNIGLSIGINGDYLWKTDYAFGVGFSYTYGSLGKYEIKKGDVIEVIGLSGNDRQNLSHFDITLGFRWSYF